MPDPVQNPTAPEGQPEGGQPAAPAVEKTWRDDLPEAIRGEKTLSKFKDPAALAQSYINLEKHAGSAVRIPGPDAKPEEIAAFQRKLGVPETADEYGVEAKVPEGMPWDKNAEKTFLKKMHGRGLTKGQAQGILDDYLEMAHQGFTAQAQEKAASAETALETCREMWGGLAERKIALIQRTVAEFGGNEFRSWLDETGLGNDPRFLKFVDSLATPMLEDNLIKGDNLGMKRSEAQAELDTIMKDKTHGYWKGDKAAVEKVRELSALAFSE